ncbi:MAG: hypothetical protein JXB39_10455 [Deltaproteobacteria bacterium]|nr:hypothetical protein [Deltaproteobacteria bacterium]
MRIFTASTLLPLLLAGAACGDEGQDTAWSAPTEPTVERPEGDADTDSDTDADTDVDTDADTDTGGKG